ncbi:hypothetical protein HCN44_000344 [Aphidius gifuensis]|uniref:Uncharacterized protein n=1 Tax=Aphidius gifuensis TaxID=684658 RepID=A0A835CN75_APHGI|nr:hypothetical protein HCN44_000344 [Aphidius gifuensis]
MSVEHSEYRLGADLKINYSIKVQYCGYAKCKQWLGRNLPTEFEKVKLDMLKAEKKGDLLKLVTVSRTPRGKKKSVTVHAGLSTFDIDLKLAATFFGNNLHVVQDNLFDVIPGKWPRINKDSIDDLGDQKR